jgi:hypothetical protein
MWMECQFCNFIVFWLVAISKEREASSEILYLFWNSAAMQTVWKWMSTVSSMLGA